MNVIIVRQVRFGASWSLKPSYSLEWLHVFAIVQQHTFISQFNVAFQRTEKTDGKYSVGTFLPLSYLKYMTENPKLVLFHFFCYLFPLVKGMLAYTSRLAKIQLLYSQLAKLACQHNSFLHTAAGKLGNKTCRHSTHISVLEA